MLMHLWNDASEIRGNCGEAYPCSFVILLPQPEPRLTRILLYVFDSPSDICNEEFHEIFIKTHRVIRVGRSDLPRVHYGPIFREQISLPSTIELATQVRKLRP
jgi:hypothetical protein